MMDRLLAKGSNLFNPLFVKAPAAADLPSVRGEAAGVCLCAWPRVGAASRLRTRLHTTGTGSATEEGAGGPSSERCGPENSSS